jgi:hypothetical protein
MDGRGVRVPTQFGVTYREVTLLRKMSFLVLFVWAFIPTTPSYAQDQPSLGDLARQIRKDKEKNAAQSKAVITDENMPSSKALNRLGDLGSSQGGGDGSRIANALASLDKAEAALNKLDPLDRATLAKAALLDNDVDFPNRRSWEDKLYAAKEQYVSHGRELFKEMRQILADVQSMQAANGGQGKLSPDDPRGKELLRRVQEIMQDAIRTESAYQGVVMEGWDRAKQAKR